MSWANSFGLSSALSELNIEDIHRINRNALVTEISEYVAKNEVQRKKHQDLLDEYKRFHAFDSEKKSRERRTAYEVAYGNINFCLLQEIVFYIRCLYDREHYNIIREIKWSKWVKTDTWIKWWQWEGWYPYRDRREDWKIEAKYASIRTSVMNYFSTLDLLSDDDITTIEPERLQLRKSTEVFLNPEDVKDWEQTDQEIQAWEVKYWYLSSHILSTFEYQMLHSRELLKVKNDRKDKLLNIL